jgi:hypothetical protein
LEKKFEVASADILLSPGQLLQQLAGKKCERNMQGSFRRPQRRAKNFNMWILANAVKIANQTSRISKIRAAPAGRRISARLLFLALGWYALCVTARANLLINGDFEQPGGTIDPNPPGYVGVGSGTQITGWTTAIGNGSSPNVFYSNNGSSNASIPNAESGSYCVQLASTTGTAFTTGSSINQTLQLNSATTYSLSFWINSTANGLLLHSSIIDYSITGAGLNFSRTATAQSALLPNKGQSWTQVTFTFNSVSIGNVKFAFTDDTSNGANSVSLDNVDLEVVTPEYSHWSAFAIFGIACVALETHRRRKVRQNDG